MAGFSAASGDSPSEVADFLRTIRMCQSNGLITSEEKGDLKKYLSDGLSLSSVREVFVDFLQEPVTRLCEAFGIIPEVLLHFSFFLANFRGSSEFV